MGKEIIHGTFSCNHEGTIEIDETVFHSTEQKDREIRRLFKRMCPDCYKKFIEEQKTKNFIEAFTHAEELHLPPLEGTENQIKYAYVIRKRIIENILKFIKNKDTKKLRCAVNKLSKTLNYIIKTYTEAAWYIERKDYDVSIILRIESKKALKTKNQLLLEKQIEKDKKNNSIIVSPNNLAIAHITYNYDAIKITYQKDTTFSSIVKSFGFRWKDVWVKYLKDNDNYKEIILKLSLQLLEAGINCYIQQKNIRDIVIENFTKPKN